jgi:hypothetical protein
MADTSPRDLVGLDIDTSTGATVVVRATLLPDYTIRVDSIEEHSPLPNANTPPAHD